MNKSESKTKKNLKFKYKAENEMNNNFDRWIDFKNSTHLMH